MNPAKRRKTEKHEVRDEVEEVRAQVNSSTTNEPTFIRMLNDDCVFEVMEWLSLDDLCSLSLTSKWFQRLALDFFCRRFEVAGEIREYADKNRFVMYDKHIKNYVKCFCNMPNISLDYSYASPAQIEELKKIFQHKAAATIK